MKSKIEEGFLDFFKGLEDPRSERSRKQMIGESYLQHFVRSFAEPKDGKMLKILEKPSLTIYANFFHLKMAFQVMIHFVDFSER